MTDDTTQTEDVLEENDQSAENDKVETPGSESVAQKSQADATNYDTGWSWGAFMFDAPFLIAIQKYAYLLVYLLMLVPFLNFIAYIGLKVYLGLKGRELAQDSNTFDSDQQRVGFFKGFDWAGKVLFFVALAVFVVGLLASLIFGATFMSGLEFGMPQ